MSDIIHDPTRGWLLLTPDGQIEIAKEDWNDLIPFVPDQAFESGISFEVSVDAEFEVWEKEFENQSGNKGIVQIARLVKAKELEKCKSPVSGGECALSSTIGLRRCGYKCGMTDSVTSDGTEAKLKEELAIGEIRQIRLATLADNAEAQVIELKRLLHDIENEVGNGHYGFSDSFLPSVLQNRISDALKKYPILSPQPTESQDELWDEVDRLVYISSGNPTLLVRSKFRIERI